jgi:hypothetical protein
MDKSELLEQMDRGEINNSLFDAICAIAARFSTDPRLDMSNPARAGDDFYKRARSAHLERIHAEDFTLGLDIIKTSLLLALYECTRFPGSKAWKSIGDVVRFAYELRLDRIDRPGAVKSSGSKNIADAFGGLLGALTHLSALLLLGLTRSTVKVLKRIFLPLHTRTLCLAMRLQLNQSLSVETYQDYGKTFRIWNCTQLQITSGFIL